MDELSDMANFQLFMNIMLLALWRSYLFVVSVLEAAVPLAGMADLIHRHY